MSDENLTLSRRKLLGSIGAVGTAAAGAGLGTTAYFSDEESFTDNSFTAGQLDLAVDWETDYDGAGAVQTESGTLDGDPATLVELSDVKPGDSGSCTLCVSITDNPAYLWLGGELTSNAENGHNDAESVADLTDGSLGIDKGELGDAIEATLSYDGGPTIETGTLKSVLDTLQFGVPLDAAPGTSGRDCFSATAGDCLVLEWSLPADVGNEVQTDSAGFGLTVFAQQCRHNDGTTNPTLDTVVAAGESIQSAVDAAAAGDVIGIEAGTFTEQVVVDESVTLTGVGQGPTVIQSPASLTSQFSADGDDHYPVVTLAADGAALWNCTVDGDRQGDGNNVFIGVAAYNASARVGSVEVTNVSEDPLGGVQHGLGIYAYNADGTDRSVVVDGCSVHDYQKVGVIGEGPGLDLCVLDSTVTGIGQTDEIGQNGIQVSDVAQAAIAGNTVRDNYYTSNSVAAGIIVFQSSDVVIERNRILDNNNGIGVSGAGDTVARRNNITGNDTGALNLGASTFDVTHNWWGGADGPSASTLYTGGETDIVTGATADGSGDAVYDAHWDPFATSPFDL